MHIFFIIQYLVKVTFSINLSAYTLLGRFYFVVCFCLFEGGCGFFVNTINSKVRNLLSAMDLRCFCFVGE